MPDEERLDSCLFAQRLLGLLADRPAPHSQQDALLFALLLELEMEAERRGASDASCRAIGRAREIAGKAVSRSYPPVIRGH